MSNSSGLLEEAELMHVVAYLINANGTGRNFLVMMCAFMTSNKLTLLSNIHVKVRRYQGVFPTGDINLGFIGHMSIRLL